MSQAGSCRACEPRRVRNLRLEPSPVGAGALAKRHQVNDDGSGHAAKATGCSERLVDAAPAGHWKTTTFVAGLRSQGPIAPLVLDGPMTGEVFRAYVEQMLAP